MVAVSFAHVYMCAANPPPLIIQRETRHECFMSPESIKMGLDLVSSL